MHDVLKKIVSFVLLAYLFFCFALQAHKNSERIMTLAKKPSYEELLQWHSLLTSFTSLSVQNNSVTSLKTTTTEKIPLTDKDLQILLAAIARGKRKPFLKYRHYILIFFACYICYKVMQATKWYNECWDTFCQELSSFFDFPFLKEWFDWFKSFFTYNPFAFLFDLGNSKEVLQELAEVKKKYREYDVALIAAAEMQKESFDRLEKGGQEMQKSCEILVQKQEEMYLELQKINEKQSETIEHVDERFATQESLMSSLKQETDEAFTSLTGLLESAVDYASETKEQLDDDLVACKETINSLKLVVEEQVEKVKKSDQATLLKEVLEVKKAINLLTPSQPEVKKAEVKKEVAVEPVKKVEQSVASKKEVEEPGFATRIKDGLVEYAYASVNPYNIRDGFERQVLVRILPKTMKAINERRAYEKSLEDKRAKSSSGQPKYS